MVHLAGRLDELGIEHRAVATELLSSVAASVPVVPNARRRAGRRFRRGGIAVGRDE
jgi:hypothetical protein